MRYLDDDSPHVTVLAHNVLRLREVDALVLQVNRQGGTAVGEQQ